MSLNTRFLKRFFRASDTVRLAGVADAEGCIKMHALMLAETANMPVTDEILVEAMREVYRALNDKQTRIWLLARDGVAIGQVMTSLVGKTATEPYLKLEVASLYVLPGMRSPGTSLGLIREVIAYAPTVGAAVIHCIASEDSLARIYERIGCDIEARIYALEVGL